MLSARCRELLRASRNVLHIRCRQQQRSVFRATLFVRCRPCQRDALEYDLGTPTDGAPDRHRARGRGAATRSSSTAGSAGSAPWMATPRDQPFWKGNRAHLPDPFRRDPQNVGSGSSDALIRPCECATGLRFPALQPDSPYLPAEIFETSGHPPSLKGRNAS